MRALVWGFIGLHAVYAIALLPLILAGGVEGDLPLYREWAMRALEHDVWIGLDAPWVYPLLALLPIVVPALLGPYLYQAVWLAMLTAANGAALWVLTEGGRRRSAYPAAWFWLATVFLLAPVSLLRLEGVTGPLVVAAFALLMRKPAVAGVLLAVATWIKVWPAAVIAAALVVLARARSVLAAGAAVTVVILAVAASLGGLRQIATFLTIQGDRALQVEAPIATPWLWMAILGVPGASVYQNEALATREVVGPGAHLAVAASTPALVVAFVIVAVLLVLARRRVASETERAHLVALGAFALVGALIVFNKVGSPQYLLWLAPVVVGGLLVARDRWMRVAIALAVAELLTTIVFPILYLPLVDLEPVPAVVLLARNAMLVALFAWSVLALARIAFARVAAEVRPRGGAPRATRAPEPSPRAR
ncbi:glycosyltransferase 87 family protein [Agromyces atrinae]|uniref:DUF2029 domain-containing protein n=1 Tax=Agromyces atrinae TaxID=592376 RepID=A0A4Q2MFB7_9MICO|nr:glycosyltransferase 87 family protein [Agromyces atrinae]NYD67992.1 putative membrane protein [Agromyces atrinae]RXZ87850.1 DUF2029 domain-containing protein [Agromyces atrinae]